MKWAEMTGLELWVLNGRNAVDHALRQLEAAGVDVTEITPQVRELANRIARRAWESAAELLWGLIARMNSAAETAAGVAIPAPPPPPENETTTRGGKPPA